MGVLFRGAEMERGYACHARDWVLSVPVSDGWARQRKKERKKEKGESIVSLVFGTISTTLHSQRNSGRSRDPFRTERVNVDGISF